MPRKKKLLNELNPGVYSNIPHKSYLALPFVSNSYLGKLARCPANAKIEQEDTPSLLFGRGVHAYILEGQRAFKKEFAISPDIDKRTKEGKEQWNGFLSKNADKNILTIEDYAKIKEIDNAVYRHPFATRLLSQGISEQTVIWFDEETGIMCKMRADRLPDGDHGVLVDLKTTEDACEFAFASSIRSYGYARQAAMYLHGIKTITGKRFDLFTFIVVEKKKPHRTEVYTLDSEYLAWGFQEYKRLLRLERQCRDIGEWPHYQYPGAQEIFKPNYL